MYYNLTFLIVTSALAVMPFYINIGVLAMSFGVFTAVNNVCQAAK